MSKLYNVISDLCDMRGIKPGKMCADLGMSRGNITDLKMGRIETLSAVSLAKIADYFGVTIEHLLGTEKEKAPTLSDERNLNETDLKLQVAAFWGGDADLTENELDDLWADAESYYKYKLEQLKKGKK